MKKYTTISDDQNGIVIIKRSIEPFAIVPVINEKITLKKAYMLDKVNGDNTSLELTLTDSDLNEIYHFESAKTLSDYTITIRNMTGLVFVFLHTDEGLSKTGNEADIVLEFDRQITDPNIVKAIYNQ